MNGRRITLEPEQLYSKPIDVVRIVAVTCQSHAMQSKNMICPRMKAHEEDLQVSCQSRFQSGDVLRLGTQQLLLVEGGEECACWLAAGLQLGVMGEGMQGGGRRLTNVVHTVLCGGVLTMEKRRRGDAAVQSAEVD